MSVQESSIRRSSYCHVKKQKVITHSPAPQNSILDETIHRVIKALFSISQVSLEKGTCKVQQANTEFVGNLHLNLFPYGCYDIIALRKRVNFFKVGD